jgi:CubicO group peptidase (beta-lactamase class C family)
VVRACWNRLDTLELVPFRAAIDAGVTAVMTAHVGMACLDAVDPPTATLSPAIMRDVLRDSLGFDGLVVTDALTMGAIVRRWGPAESAVRAFLAGSDMLLMPADLRAAVDGMVSAVLQGRVSVEAVDRSVRRVLELKRQAGLFQQRTVSLERVPAIVGNRQFQDAADDIAARALTLIRPGAIERFRAERGPWALILYGEETFLSLGGALTRELGRLGDTATSFRLYPASGSLSYDSARTVIQRSRRVLFGTSVRVISGRGHIAMPDSLASLITQTAITRPSALVSFGNPYLLSQVPQYQGAYLVAWSAAPAAERAVARALAGGAPISGRLPITLGGDYPRGLGIELPRVEPAGTNGSNGPLPAAPGTGLASVASYLAQQAREGAFPGGVLLVGQGGRTLLTAPFGRYGEDDPRPVSAETIYDLASLTKVVALTTACMLLVAEGRLDLDRPVRDYVPAFAGAGKSRVLVRHLLTHTSGLPAWRPFHELAATAEAALDSVLATPLDTTPGAVVAYSDLGAIALTHVVEGIAGEPLDAFVGRRVFAPLGMYRTRFLPPADWIPLIAPTERDPWRGRVLRGEVHDENAARLGGVSGHAGLFSTAPDLARFAYWLLDAYHGRLEPSAPVAVPRDVVRMFLARQPGPEGSTRALGWDTPSPSGRGSSGSLLSSSSFGHTGFTGTSIWMDPERDLVIILLTNRVHPTRENRAIAEVRRFVADAVVQAMMEAR